MVWKSISYITVAALYCCIAPLANAETCNHKESPWLTPECKAPSITNPDDACRRVALMKSQGLTFEAVVARGKSYDAESDRFAHVHEYLIAQKSWEICNSAMEIKCLQNATASVTTYKSLMGLYTNYENQNLPAFVNSSLNTNRYDLNFARNFKVLSKLNLEILSETHTFVTSMNENRTQIATRSDLDQSEKKLSEFGSQIIQKSKSLSQAEARFLTLLDQSVRELDEQSLRNGNISRGVDCSMLTGKMNRYTDDVIEHKKSIIDYKNSLTRMHNSRYRTISIAFNDTRYNNLAAYASKFNARVEDLITELGKSQVLDRFMWNFNDFWQERFKNGLADNLHTRFYFYSEPLAKLEILRAELDGIRKSAINLPVDEASKNEVVNLIDSKIKMTDRDLKFITSKGWEGLFALQKASASKRIELALTIASCVEISKEFLSRAELVTNLEDFDNLSPFYKESVNACGALPNEKDSFDSCRLRYAFHLFRMLTSATYGRFLA